MQQQGPHERTEHGGEVVKFRKNDKRIIEVAAAAAELPSAAFFVEIDQGMVLVNHPESMRWTDRTRYEIERCVRELTGMTACVT